LLNKFRNITLQRKVAQSKYFSNNWYIDNYKQQLVNFSGSPVKHYLITGWKLGNDPSPLFSSQKYLSRYKDVRDSDVFPGAICTDFDSMLVSLFDALNTGVKDVEKYERVRHMFFDFDDQLNSQRVAELVYNLG
jgi:hypothetical protein